MNDILDCGTRTNYEDKKKRILCVLCVSMLNHFISTKRESSSVYNFSGTAGFKFFKVSRTPARER